MYILCLVPHWYWLMKLENGNNCPPPHMPCWLTCAGVEVSNSYVNSNSITTEYGRGILLLAGHEITWNCKMICLRNVEPDLHSHGKRDLVCQALEVHLPL